MELPWEVACAHYQLALWGVHTKAEEELSSEAERRAHVSAASAPSPLINIALRAALHYQPWLKN